jgi:hypothetical protein
METNSENAEMFDERQSLQVIHEMIQVSQKKLKNDGILFILWGWSMLIINIISYLQRAMVTTHTIYLWMDYSITFIKIMVLYLTTHYILKQRKKVQTYIGISLRYVWFSMFGCLAICNIILFNMLKEANFELQHPIFMVFIAFATAITGAILRYKLIFVGGIVFAILAFLSSFFKIEEQLLVEAAAWLIAFIIPGHILYSKRNA